MFTQYLLKPTLTGLNRFFSHLLLERWTVDGIVLRISGRLDAPQRPPKRRKLSHELLALLRRRRRQNRLWWRQHTTLRPVNVTQNIILWRWNWLRRQNATLWPVNVTRNVVLWRQNRLRWRPHTTLRPVGVVLWRHNIIIISRRCDVKVWLIRWHFYVNFRSCLVTDEQELWKMLLAYVWLSIARDQFDYVSYLSALTVPLVKAENTHCWGRQGAL